MSIKHATIVEGVFVAAGLAVATVPLGMVARVVASPSGAAKLTAIALMAAYTWYLFSLRAHRVGRLTVVGLLSLALMVLLAAPLSAGEFLICCVVALWGTRVLLLYRGILLSLADGGLVLLGIAAAQWGYGASYSFAVATWCFFLVQSLFVLLKRGDARNREECTSAVSEFDRAHEAAQEALRAMIAVQ